MDKRHDEAVELAGIIENKMRDNTYMFSDVAAIDTANEILNLGYHKTIWHKVAEGDLPKRANKDIHAVPVQTYYEDSNGMKSNGPLYYFFLDNSFHTLGNPKAVNVIAWAELPKYEE